IVRPVRQNDDHLRAVETLAESILLAGQDAARDRRKVLEEIGIAGVPLEVLHEFIRLVLVPRSRLTQQGLDPRTANGSLVIDKRKDAQLRPIRDLIENVLEGLDRIIPASPTWRWRWLGAGRVGRPQHASGIIQ